MTKLATLFAAALAATPAAATGLTDTGNGDQVDRNVAPVMEPRELQPDHSVFWTRGDLLFRRSLLAVIDYDEMLDPGDRVVMIAGKYRGGAESFAVRLEHVGSRYRILGSQPTVPPAAIEQSRIKALVNDKAFATGTSQRERAEKRKIAEALAEVLIRQRDERRFARYETSLDESRGSRITAAWDAMVRRSRYPVSDMVDVHDRRDAVSSQFEYIFVSRENLVGLAWHPANVLRPGMLAALGTALFDYCMDKKPESLARMDARLVELEGLLAKDATAP